MSLVKQLNWHKVHTKGN